MNQHTFGMEVHANYKRNDIARAMAQANPMKELPAHKSSGRSTDALPVRRFLQTLDVEGFSRSLRFLVRGCKLTLRGRAAA